MMDHAFFVFSSYGATALVFCALLLWLIVDGRARKRELAALEKSGARRRSDRNAKDGS